ncbi:hypothetical protein HHI36_018786 [Cryptolaemus montrouzieri]|uniref:protein xylosyltransferase n=1 Tax=Cryptolaemus montrouzieri TaxID=559131 RepID=A0ABD2P0Y2_9CUCU
MVIVRNTASRWFRRYKIFFIFGTTILVFQVLLTLKFFALSKNNKEQKWQPVLERTSFTSEGKIRSGSFDDEIAGNVPNRNIKVKSKPQLKLEDLNFTPNCKISEREAISAINRAKSKKCKQLIANITCLSSEGRLYPKKLSNFCVDHSNNTGKALGCFKDDKEFRLLSGFYGVHSKDNSPGNCMRLCLQSGFPYAGVEYSNECFCGSDEPSFTKKLPDSSCNMKCPGNIHETCGGYYTLNIFRTGIKKFVPQIANTEISNGKRVRIVFLLTLNGRALRQVKRLLKLIYHESHFYYIHVDVRQDYLFRKLVFLEKRFPNIKLSRKRFATIWGGASLLKMLRSCMNDLLHLEWGWDFILNLSESDYPVKTIEKLTEFLTANRDKNFVKSHGREVQRFIQKQGLDKTFVECDTHMWRVADRKLPWGIQIDGGSDWIALNREFVKYVAGDNTDDLIKGLLKVFHHTLLPAESFFHTALRNSIFCDTYVDNNLHVTNWKRKLGCKCQYKHVVDWCGCSPNDFKPEDWPRILGTETRQLYFARKFEPIISQSVIYQLELWLFSLEKPRVPVESLNSYWQSIYHYQDLGVEPDDGLFTITHSAIRYWLSSFNNASCIPKISKVLEITSYHFEDSYKYTLTKIRTSQGILELAFRHLQTLSILKPSSLTNRLEHLSVNSDYDQKEQMSRNFAMVLSPHSDFGLIYHFSSSTSTKVYNISFLWIDPTGKLVEVSEITLDETGLIGHTKFNQPQPHKPGSWSIRLVHQNMLLVDLKFLVTPLEFTSSVLKTKISSSPPDVLPKSFNDNFSKFLPNDFDRDVLEQLSLTNLKRKGDELKEWIDILFAKFFQLKKCARLRELKFATKK